jgi:hypothetical protein
LPAEAGGTFHSPRARVSGERKALARDSRHERHDRIYCSTAAFFGWKFHPSLLQQCFGSSPRPHVLAEWMTNTPAASGRHKFEWVGHTEYRTDRAKRYVSWRIAPRLMPSVFCWRTQTSAISSPRRPESGFVKNIPVVSDDGGMARVAEANEIECWSTVKLLRLMQTGGRIDLETVTQIIEYWDYENDLPMPRNALRKVFKEYFGCDCPI